MVTTMGFVTGTEFPPGDAPLTALSQGRLPLPPHPWNAPECRRRHTGLKGSSSDFGEAAW